MKKYSNIVLSTLLMLFIITSCNSGNNLAVNMTIVPEGALSISTIKDLEDASEIIRKRLNNLGIPNEKISMDVSAAKMILSVNGIDTGKIEVLKGIVTTPGDLGLWETYENGELITSLVGANSKSKDIDFGVKISPAESPVSDSSLLDILTDSTAKAERDMYNMENPLFSILQPSVDSDGKAKPSCMIGLAMKDDTAAVNRVLENREISFLFPRNVIFLWSRYPYKYDKSGSLFELHAIKAYSLGDRAPLDGRDISSAEAKAEKWSPVLLRVSMNAQGAKKWSLITAGNVDRCIAVVSDGYVYSYPRVQNEIKDGETEITGDFSMSEASILASILSSGGDVLPLKLLISELQITVKQ
jgi:SecD/SecF fusion protein